MSQQPPQGWGQPPEQPPQGREPSPGQQPPGWGPPSGQPAWGPPPSKPRGTRPWYKKKRFLIPLVLVALLVVAGVLSDGAQQPDGTATQQTSGSQATDAPATTEAVATTREPATTAAPKPATPAAQTITGRGKTASKAFTVTEGMTLFRLQHRGQANFIVDLLTSSGQDVDNLVNEIGNFTGATANGLDAGRYLFRVEADGPWTIRIEQPRPASGRGLPATVSGRGQSVAGPFQGVGEGVRFALRHRGQANFIVDVLDADGRDQDNLANEIGTFQGSTVNNVPDGVFWLNIQADGQWTIALQKL
jgi:hypothetical protein